MGQPTYFIGPTRGMSGLRGLHGEDGTSPFDQLVNVANDAKQYVTKGADAITDVRNIFGADGGATPPIVPDGSGMPDPYTAGAGSFGGSGTIDLPGGGAIDYNTQQPPEKPSNIKLVMIGLGLFCGLYLMTK